MAEPNQPAVVENQSPTLENSKQATHALTSEEAERLISYLEQEIPNKRIQEEENRRQEEFDRQRIENEEEYQFWIRKFETRCARKKRERQERLERYERRWIKTRSSTESESDEEGGEAVKLDEDDSSSEGSIDPEKEARERQRQERDDAEMYLLHLAEKAQPRIFARTMSEPLTVDSNGEEIPGMDVYGNTIAAEVQEEENEGSEDDEDGEDDEDDEDGGYGPANSTSTNSSVDFSYEEEGFNTVDDDDQW